MDPRVFVPPDARLGFNLMDAMHTTLSCPDALQERSIVFVLRSRLELLLHKHIRMESR
jgi:hypothetical protein